MGHRVLVTGGAGYIGSVVVEQLLARGHVPVVLDDLSTGHRAAVASGVEFVQGNVGDRRVLEDVFHRHGVDALMHFAAFALVAESVAHPAKYYANNVVAGRALLDATVAAGVRRVIFSSSCTIYGHRGAEPIAEDTPAAPVNPYGETKVEFERMLTAAARSPGRAGREIRRAWGRRQAAPSGDSGGGRATRVWKRSSRARGRGTERTRSGTGTEEG